MELKEMIYKRKSVRKYSPNRVDETTINKINQFCTELKPLYNDIKVRAEIIDKENVKCICPWTTSQVVAVFSEEKDGYLENVGFMFQQLELYLQTIGLGVCWLGMGRLDSYAASSRNDGLKFVIMLAFGYPKDELRSDIMQFKRRMLSEISDKEDLRLEPARIAPSSVNSQPWYFVHDEDIIHTYCVKQGFFKTKALGDMNRIDIGIALAHMYVANSDTFDFFKTEEAQDVKGHGYIGSFKI